MQALIAFCICTCVVLAQGGGAVVGAGYSLIAPVAAAPGQVITIYVTGVGSVTKKVSAGNPPLPTKLGGISATLSQGGATTAAPIFAVFPFNACSGAPGFACGSIMGITLQIPFELEASGPAYLEVSDEAG
ncbi:MAG TPA: hypothetical protein VFO27_13805, partial [Bryobacteraceae bacterium]|nr:hypothetical protein [Bryobacteraceae bacterium]